VENVTCQIILIHQLLLPHQNIPYGCHFVIFHLTNHQTLKMYAGVEV